jgi:hypothetical protein
MKKPEEYRAFADSSILTVAEALKARDFETFNSHFDPTMSENFSQDDFDSDASEEQEDLGILKHHWYMGKVKGNQEEYPGSVRFVYGGTFTHAEGLIIMCVHERDDMLFLNEHVCYWD